MYCKNCGHKNIDTAKFCQKCGTSLNIPIVDEAKYQIEELPSSSVEPSKEIQEIISETKKLYDFANFSFTVEKPTFRFTSTSLKTNVSVKDDTLTTELNCKSRILKKSNKQYTLKMSDIKSTRFCNASTMALLDLWIFFILLFVGLFIPGEYGVLGVGLLSGLYYWRMLLPSLEISTISGKKYNIFFTPANERQDMLKLKSIITKSEYDENNDELKISFNKKVFVVAIVFMIISFLGFFVTSDINESAKDQERLDQIRQSHFAGYSEYTVEELIEKRFECECDWVIKVDDENMEYPAAEYYVDLDGKKIHMFTILFTNFSPIAGAHKVEVIFVDEDLSAEGKEAAALIKTMYDDIYVKEHGEPEEYSVEKINMSCIITIPSDYNGDETSLYQLDETLSQIQEEVDIEHQELLDELNQIEESSFSINCAADYIGKSFSEILANEPNWMLATDCYSDGSRYLYQDTNQTHLLFWNPYSEITGEEVINSVCTISGNITNDLYIGQPFYDVRQIYDDSKVSFIGYVDWDEPGVYRDVFDISTSYNEMDLIIRVYLGYTDNYESYIYKVQIWRL